MVRCLGRKIAKQQAKQIHVSTQSIFFLCKSKQLALQNTGSPGLLTAVLQRPLPLV